MYIQWRCTCNTVYELKIHYIHTYKCVHRTQCPLNCTIKLIRLITSLWTNKFSTYFARGVSSSDLLWYLAHASKFPSHTRADSFPPNVRNLMFEAIIIFQFVSIEGCTVAALISCTVVVLTVCVAVALVVWVVSALVFWTVAPPWGPGGLSRECVLRIPMRVVKGD